VTGSAEASNETNRPGSWDNGVWTALATSAATSVLLSNAQDLVVFDGHLYVLGLVRDSRPDVSHSGSWKDGDWNEVPRPHADDTGAPTKVS